MSATADAQRKEEAFEARLERAKKQMLLDQQVLRAEVNGLSQRQTALALGIDWRTLRSIRRHLHLAPQANHTRLADSNALCRCEDSHV